MKWKKSTADLFIPDSHPLPQALTRTTHLGIGAHQDDLEIMAFHGIVECYGRQDKWFTGVTCTNGAGSARIGIYANHSDEDMMRVRRDEQRRAAAVGGYAAVVQLDYSSAEIKNPRCTDVTADLVTILELTCPEFVYTHNPADKHDTHIGVLCKTIDALRGLPADRRPKKVFGCEVWRDLDWMVDSDKVPLNVSGRDHLAMALTGLYDSQIAGGKRYDLATMGRRRANATYFESHGVDSAESLNFAMDLTPLITDCSVNVLEYVDRYLLRFKEDVMARLSRITRST